MQTAGLQEDDKCCFLLSEFVGGVRPQYCMCQNLQKIPWQEFLHAKYLLIKIIFQGFDEDGQFIPLHKRGSDVTMFRGIKINTYQFSIYSFLFPPCFISVNFKEKAFSKMPDQS